MIQHYLFSYNCYICHKEFSSNGICNKCRVYFKFIDDICQKCGSYMFAKVLECYKCKNFKYFKIARSLFETNYHMMQLIYQIKYKKKIYLLDIFINLIIERYIDIIRKFDYITYIPMHFNKYFFREYNIPQILAYRLAQKTEISFVHAFNKIKNNRTQASILDKRQRKRNVQGVFTAINIDIIKGKKILIIDDIRTTGATSNIAAYKLKKYSDEIGLITIMSYD